MMIQITSDTLFWSIFYSLQFLSISGFGIVRFGVTREHAKLATMFVGMAYVTNSGFNVTIDNPSLNVLFKYILLVQQLVFFYFLVKYFRANLVTLNRNLAYIQS